MKNYLKYIGKRVFYMFLTLFLIATITFFLMKLLPGSPYANEEQLTQAQLELMNAKYGLDKPVFVQYLIYITGLFRLDFGQSFQYNSTVANLIFSRVGPSFQLGFQALIFGTIVGSLLGMIAAMKQNISSILPTMALAISPIADSARFVRTEMVEVLHSDYIELARAKGLSRFEVAFKHGFRNAIIPLVTILGPMLVGLMTGSMVIENIFAIPGIGEQFVKSILTNDYPTIMGVTMLYSALLVFVILIVDLLYGWIDPRIRITDEGGEA